MNPWRETEKDVLRILLGLLAALMTGVAIGNWIRDLASDHMVARKRPESQEPISQKPSDSSDGY